MFLKGSRPAPTLPPPKMTAQQPTKKSFYYRRCHEVTEGASYQPSPILTACFSGSPASRMRCWTSAMLYTTRRGSQVLAVLS